MTDYSDLLTNVRNYTETSSDVLSDAVINTFIVNVENKLFKEVDLSYYRKYDTANLTAGNAFLSLPGDWRATRFLQIVVSDVRTTLLQKDISFMTEYWPDRTSSDATVYPKYYADWDQDTHYIAPTPNTAVAVELAYLRMPDRLSASDTSTWISLNAPNVLLYGCIL